MPTLAELIQERADVLTKATELARKVREDGYQLSGEDLQFIENVAKRCAELDVEIGRIEEENRAAAAAARTLEQLAERGRQQAATQRRGAPINSNRNDNHRKVNVYETDEYRAYFDAVFRRDQYEAARAASVLESRALSLGTDASGGYFALPTALANALVQQIDELSGLVGSCTRMDLGNEKSLGIAKVVTRGDDADWTTEVASVTEEASLALSRRDLTPVMLTKMIKASLRFIQRSPMAQPFIISELARKFAVTFEKALLTGTGSGEPLGVFIASSNGISTGRNITTGSTTAFDYGDLVEFKYNLKAPYLADQSFAMVVHRGFVQRALTLLDSQNRPIFMPSTQPGLADTLLGMPIRYSEFAPNTYTAAKYIAVAGAFRHYWFADGMNYSVQIVDQLFAGTNQIAFYGRTEADGSPILEEAFTRLITAAS